MSEPCVSAGVQTGVGCVLLALLPPVFPPEWPSLGPGNRRGLASHCGPEVVSESLVGLSFEYKNLHALGAEVVALW